MKKYLTTLLLLVFITGTSCNEKTDPEKEKEAIKALIEQEKDGFFSQNFSLMAETWVQEPSSVKIYFNSSKGLLKIEGWDAISQHDQNNLADTTLDRQTVNLSFRNFQINLLSEESAWVMHEAVWEGMNQGNPVYQVQTRINVLEKVDGNWKFSLMSIYNQPKEE
jgi:hypothetical protein